MSMTMREFSAEDDELIRAQPKTGMGLKRLERVLHTSRDAMMRRAEELGVTLKFREIQKKDKSRVRVYTEEDSTYTSPIRTFEDGVDRLLYALYLHHPEKAPAPPQPERIEDEPDIADVILTSRRIKVE
jgi:hypothetical protein